MKTEGNCHRNSGADGRWGRAGMDGYVESYTGSSEIIVIAENHGEVAEKATAACGGDGASVGVDLALQ